jgi:tetratricopeptide (TPR) repeat protein
MARSMNVTTRAARLSGIVALSALLVSCGSTPAEKAAKFLRKGASYVQVKDYNRAAIEFRNATSADPKNAEAFYQLGLASISNGDPNAAFVALKKATELDPKHSGAQLKLAELMATTTDKGTLEAASKILQNLAAERPNDTEVMESLAVTELQMGNSEAGTKLLDQALKESPADLQAAILLARVKLSQSDQAGAQEAMQKVSANAPKSAPAAFALGTLYLTLQKTEQAATEFQRSLELDPDYAPSLYSLAQLQVYFKQLDHAQQSFQRLSVLKDPKFKEYRPLYGYFLFQRGQRDAGLAEFQRLLKNDPNDAAARTRLVSAYLSMPNFPEAQKLLGEALERNKKDTNALLQRIGLSLATGGDIEAAERDLHDVLKTEKNSPIGHYLLSEVYRLRGLAKNQQLELDQALKDDPSYLPARLALIRRFLDTNNPKAAQNLIDQAPREQRNALPLMIERNWALIALGQMKEAREQVDLGLRAARVPDLVLQDGALRMNDKKFADAAANAEEVLAQNPEDFRAAHLLFSAHAAQNQQAVAIEKLRGIAAQHPRSARLQFEVGQLLIRSGQRGDGKSALEKAVAIDPSFLSARLELARLDAAEHRYDAARQNLKAVLALEPRNTAAQLMLGDTEMLADSRPAAIAAYRSVLELDASNVQALNNLAYMLAMENPEEALPFARRAVEGAPDSAAVYDTLGWVYYRKGTYSSAVEQLKIAVEKEPTPRRQFHLAMSYLKAGEKQLGQKMLLAALNKEPNLSKTERGW